MDGANELRWAGRVPRHKINTLYENDAQGIYDEELIDDIGLAIYARCDSILTVTQAHEGNAKCPRCGSLIAHNWGKDLLVCSCSWQTTWEAYHKTYRGKQLHGGGAKDWLARYMKEYESARSPQEKMLAIDRLIHMFHCQFNERPSRPVAVNVIGGSIRDVLELLSGLAYSGQSTPNIQDNFTRYREILPRTYVAHLQDEIEKRAQPGSEDGP